MLMLTPSAYSQMCVWLMSRLCRNDNVAIIDVDCTKDDSKDLCSKYGVKVRPPLGLVSHGRPRLAVTLALLGSAWETPAVLGAPPWFGPQR
jgi:hypothetical protein